MTFALAVVALAVPAVLAVLRAAVRVEGAVMGVFEEAAGR